MRRMAGWIVAQALLVSACAPAPDGGAGEREELRVERPGPDTLMLPQAEWARARQTATALGQDLAALIFSTMEEQGVEAAVGVCGTAAGRDLGSSSGRGAQVTGRPSTRGGCPWLNSG